MSDRVKKYIATLSAAVTFIFTGFFFVDERYARAEEAEENKRGIANIRLNLTYQKALDNYYNIKQLSLKYPDDASLKDQLAKAQDEVVFLKAKLEQAQ